VPWNDADTVAVKKVAAALSPARIKQSGQADQEAVQVRLQAIADTSTLSYSSDAASLAIVTEQRSPSLQYRR
jgi:hypothetical protein